MNGVDQTKSTLTCCLVTNQLVPLRLFPLFCLGEHLDLMGLLVKGESYLKFLKLKVLQI
jgi:hypothetical protein